MPGTEQTRKQEAEWDAIVVGAGFGGMYMLHLLREQGLRVLAIERGAGVGGTWYWNRYPGCRCDVESMEYSYQFSDALQQDWNWSERYAPQDEILAYAEHVAQRFDLNSHIRFQTIATGARFDEARATWELSVLPAPASDPTASFREPNADAVEVLRTRYLIMATGCLSTANVPDIPGMDDFSGAIFHTGAWPAAGVDFRNRRVGIVGTGSSAIQSIPLIAAQAQSLTVFQRTPNYSIPAQNGVIDAQRVADIKANYADFRARNKQAQPAFGADYPRRTDSVLDATDAEREARFEEYWAHGGFMFLGAFGDIGTDMEANAIAAEFVRNKIRSIVSDPQTAEALCPITVLGCKRLCADTGYFETYNRDNVRLVDVNAHPIHRLTEQGMQVGKENHEFDAIVFATGFDAMTGALLKMDIVGAGGLSLRDKWAAGPRTYLGLMTAQFPNLFMMTGPGSPSVLANMITGVEQHAEYIAQMIERSDASGCTSISAQPAAEDAWVDVVNMRAQATLFPRCNSWYLGANVPGKPRVFMPYIGFPDYVARLEEIRASGYEGFEMTA